MFGHTVAAVRFGYNHAAALAAGEELDVWVADLGHVGSSPKTPVLRPAILEVIKNSPTYAYDETTSRLDRTVELGRRLTCRVVCESTDIDEEIVHLYTTKKARKAALFGEGARKAKGLYVDIETPGMSDDSKPYRFHRTAGTNGSLFLIHGFVHGQGPADTGSEIVAALESHFEGTIGDYVVTHTWAASDLPVTANFEIDGEPEKYEGTLGEITPVISEGRTIDIDLNEDL